VGWTVDEVSKAMRVIFTPLPLALLATSPLQGEVSDLKNDLIKD